MKVGDRIVPYPWLTCGTCDGCRRHGPGICTICESAFCYGRPQTVGKSKFNASVAVFPHFKGGFAEYTYLFPEPTFGRSPTTCQARSRHCSIRRQ
ncbi:MAG: hypothetical protein C5B58_14215 [Acidobacteria bacterium]|nr:MAG: hypothetical protein C5B58_14215 [Acidobacteriota bacterium]